MNALDALYIALAAAASPWLARKRRRGWPERLGRTPPVAPRRAGDGGPLPRLLIHAVSVGEVNALRALVPLLTPRAQVIISVGTDTGIARAGVLFAGSCDIVRYPVDLSWCVRRFLDAVRPEAVALVELELWPNFIRACRARAVPVCIINGRLSERSFAGYQRLRRWLAPVFGALEFAAVQDEAYAARFEAMGVAPESCLLTGSMKWDAARIEDDVPGAGDLARGLGIDRSRPLIVAGSTGSGEEALLHAACPRGAQLLCAPRRPERFDEAAAAMPGCVRRMRPAEGAPASGRFVLDTIGELPMAYSLADVAVIGRSFGNLFGSDPVEPIALGRPVVCGPAMGDFASMAAAFADAGGMVRTTREGLAGVLRELLADGARRAEIASRGRACIRANQGASARHAALLLSLLGAGARLREVA